MILILIYLAGVSEAGVEVILVHPVLQIADPESADLLGGSGLLLLSLDVGGPHVRRRRLSLGRHHGVRRLLLLLRRRLLVLLRRLLLHHGGWSHAVSWLHHLSNTESGRREREG